MTICRRPSFDTSGAGCAAPVFAASSCPCRSRSRSPSAGPSGAAPPAPSSSDTNNGLSRALRCASSSRIAVRSAVGASRWRCSHAKRSFAALSALTPMHGAGGKRRQPIAHEARGRRAPRGVLRFDRDDDRPEHLGARFQRVQVAHGQRLRRQQVRHVAPQRQARRDRRRHDRGQEGRPEDRRPVARGPARPAGAESTVGDGGVHASRLCSGRATFPSVRRRRPRPASVQFRTRRAQNLAAGSAPDRGQNHPPTMLDAPTKRRRLDTFSTE